MCFSVDRCIFTGARSQNIAPGSKRRQDESVNGPHSRFNSPRFLTFPALQFLSLFQLVSRFLSTTHPPLILLITESQWNERLHENSDVQVLQYISLHPHSWHNIEHNNNHSLHFSYIKIHLANVRILTQKTEKRKFYSTSSADLFTEKVGFHWCSWLDGAHFQLFG